MGNLRPMPWVIRAAWFFAAVMALGAPLPTDAPLDPGLTAEEKSWIAAHPEVSVAFSESFPPYSQRLPDGRMVGIDLDYLDLIARRTGLVFRPVIINDWSKAEEALKTGQVDLLTGLVHTPQREAYMDFSVPYILAPDVIVTRTDMPYVLDAGQLLGLKVGRVRGFAGEMWERLAVEAPSRLYEFESMNAVFEALSRGTIDATVTDTVNAAYTIKSLHLSNLRLGSVIGGPGPTYLGVTRKKPGLVRILDKAITSITTQERREIDERWIALDLAPSKWLLAFKVVASLTLAVLIVFLLVFLHNRRLAAELAQRRRIQLQLEETHAQLARVSEEKSELMRMVAHDLRSPLTGFAMGTDLLRVNAAQLSRSDQDILAKMAESVGLMRRMVDDLVDTQMIEEGRHDYQSVEVDFGALLRQAVAAFSATAAQKKIRMELLMQDPVMTLRTDARALRQVVDNLLSNALKYSPPHTEVLIDLRLTGGVWQLLVRDRGPGVKPEEREKIFEKYSRGTAKPTAGEKSTGLGLWIVRRVVTALHGRVWCEAGPGAVGSVFVVEMPLTPPAA